MPDGNTTGDGERRDDSKDKNIIRTRLLREETVLESDFPNHTRIAKALERTVTSDEPGQAIALIGKLGSGKSTVIRLLENRLCSSSKDGGNQESSNAEIGGESLEARVFIYDAWTHREESIRRSFIQELSADLQSVGWGSEKEFDGHVERVVYRKSSSTNRLTLPGAFIAILLTLLPPAMLLSQSGSWDRFANDVPLIGEIEIGLIGGMLALSIVVVLGLFLIWISLFDKGRRLLNSETSSEVAERSKPSSVDFRESFKGIVGQALSNRRRRLILVVDNLDRLAIDDVVDVWSTLQLFFDIHISKPLCVTGTTNRDNIDTWKERYWLIVPLSPSSLGGLRSFGEEMSGTKEQRRVLAEFVDKTFQLNQRVPRPVPSEQETFFKKQFRCAFPDLGGSKVENKIRELFAMHGDGSTPRAVKRYLNDVVGSVRQWNNEIPVPSQALYQLLHRKFKEEFLQRVKSEKGNGMTLGAESIVTEVSPSTLRRQLIALHFGVRPKEALQVLVGNDLNQALRRGNSERVEKLQKQGFSGFEQLLRDQVRSIASGGASNLLPLVATAISGLEGEEIKHAWNRLAIAVRSKDRWDFYNEAVGEGLATLLRKLDSDTYEETAPALLELMSRREDEKQAVESI